MLSTTTNNKSVLIVEDEMILALVLEKMVAGIGHETIAKVTTGKLAIEVAKNQRPDIILIDIRLQGDMDGISTMSKIHQKYDIPGIFISGSTDPNFNQRVKNIDYLDFLVKPVTQHQLSRSLDLAS